MAIEIIYDGTKDPVSYDLQCRKDETIIRCLESDLKYNSDQRDGDYWSWKCPTCHTENTVTTGILHIYETQIS